jgi:hypothetical protein
MSEELVPKDAFILRSAPEGKRTDSPSKFHVYANATEIGLSPWDVRINLMENTGTSGKLELLVHGTVVMSAIHAKALLAALQQTLSVYEEKVSELDFKKAVENFAAFNAKPSE